MIMPTLLRVYSHYQANSVVRGAVEFTCKQFFILHRNPFVLQVRAAQHCRCVPLNTPQVRAAQHCRCVPLNTALF